MVEGCGATLDGLARYGPSKLVEQRGEFEAFMSNAEFVCLENFTIENGYLIMGRRDSVSRRKKQKLPETKSFSQGMKTD